jgi:hypothetical protein
MGSPGLVAFYARKVRIDHSARTRHLRRARLAVVSGVGTALLVVSARAENQNAPAAHPALSDTVVVYQAPEGCPSQADFESRVRSRMPARESMSPRRIEARLSRSGTRIAASVVLTDANGAVTTRRIVAASCNEAVDGLALIVALTVDPLEAHGGPVPPATESESTVPSSSADATSGDRGASQGEPKGNTPQPQQTAPVVQVEAARKTEAPTPETNEPAPTSSSSRLQFGASLSFLVASGTGPAASPGGELALVASVGKAPAVGLRAGGRLVASASDSFAGGRASFSWWSAFLGGCVGTDASGVFVLSGCAVYELGQLGATGSQTRNAASSMALWQALGPELRFDWAFAPPVALDAAVAGMFPLRPERFFLGEDVVYQLPTVGIRAEIGAAIRF